MCIKVIVPPQVPSDSSASSVALLAFQNQADQSSSSSTLVHSNSNVPRRQSRATRQNRSAVAKLREDLADNDPDDALTIEDYFELGDAEFARVWKRSLRLLKKAFESNGGGGGSNSNSNSGNNGGAGNNMGNNHNHNGSSRSHSPPNNSNNCCDGNNNNNASLVSRRPGSSLVDVASGLVFHAKVHRDILENEAIWFDFFLVDRGQYTDSNPPFYDTAEQAIIILSTQADSKQPWGSQTVREEVHEMLILAQRLLERLQDLSQRYGDDERIYRTNHVAHTLTVQALHFHSGTGNGGGRNCRSLGNGGAASSQTVCPPAVEAFRTCAELELADHSVGSTGERVTSWIPGRQRMTLAKLREVPDSKVWKWIIKHNRSCGARRW